jgi:predicted glycosyltransferase involved in capsule biosynthesis
MIDFKDVTFIVPIRFDSQDRRDNFKISMNFLLKNFDTNIIVLENDENSNEEFVKSVSNRIKYVFEKNSEKLFHRTKILNTMTKMSETNIVVNYDVDVVFKVEQYIKSRKKILEGCDMVFPYLGNFYDVQKNQFHLVESNEIDKINLGMCTLFNPNSVGGAFFFNKERYTTIGLENENFVSWGHEDWERIVRVETMGYKLCRVEGVLYHLTHSRTHNSSDRNPFFHINGQEFHRIRSMDKEQLTNHIKNWGWV